MKRHNNLFPQIISVENLFSAYRGAKRGKSTRPTVKNFDNNVMNNLALIQQSLINRTFTTSEYRVKTIFEPKKREIHMLPFAPDRIVQHALINILGPIWDNLFIDDSYACRPGRGIHAASRRTMEFVRQFKYCLKADISKFYQSVNHQVLYGIVMHKIKCQDTLRLLLDIIDSVSGSSSIPIGNYTSQWFGNLYLNELDQLLKHMWKVKAYVRYCDDFCLFDNDKKRLRELARVIDSFLTETLELRLSKCDIFPVKRGVDFLGYRHFPTHILLRKSTAKRLCRRLRKLPDLLEKKDISQEQFRSILDSYRGWIKWCNTYHLSLSVKMSSLVELAHAA